MVSGVIFCKRGMRDELSYLEKVVEYCRESNEKVLIGRIGRHPWKK